MLNFDAFFNALYGREPFPWQQRMAKRACHGRWPEGLALPTGSGKTACIDIAVFALAVQADRAASERTAPRRIFFVIDRRVVVEQAYRAASRLVKRLAEARGGILGEVADCLRDLAGGDDPLACHQLRGGIYRDDAWARTPTQPTVILSTVDQIGSRLVYRGYGTSRWIRPIHAGLAANDALIFLDEAHCSNPLLETLRGIARFRTWATQPVASPFQVVVMTATPPPGIAAERAEKADVDHPVLGRRLEACKPARLEIVKAVRGADPLETLSEALARNAISLKQELEQGVIAIVANRVRTAKEVHSALRELVPDADHLLLTGRMRPYDRDRLMERWEPRLRSERVEDGRPLFVAATQCVEVGADFDFDGLVTECASLDALRQRFGRLNRAGRRDSAPAVILVRKDQRKKSEPDPIYGDALAGTFSFLEGLAKDGTVDMGVGALEPHLSALSPESLATLLPPASRPPTLLPAHLDAWVQTAPEPIPSPDPARFLHGTDPKAAEAQVVFRADLSPEDASEDTWIAAVGMLPPTSAEAFPVPLPALRRWLATRQVRAGDELHDVDGARETDEDVASEDGVRFLRWNGPEESTLCSQAVQVRPGDTVVLPATLAADFPLGTFPDESLVDVAEATSLASKRRAVVRFQPRVIEHWPEEWRSDRVVGTAALDDGGDAKEALDGVLDSVQNNAAAPEWLRTAARELRRDGRRRLSPHPSGGWVLSGSARIGRDFTDEDATSSATVQVGLAQHSGSVRDRARLFATRCGLPATLAEDLALAGWIHDLGKADSRFQLWLHGADPLRAAAALEPLAKSGRLPRSPVAVRRAREQSQYPSGGRHELLSVRLAESQPALLEKAADRELVLHLVESHHGRCRPFAPVIVDSEPIDVELAIEGLRLSANSRTELERIDQGVPERFWSLVRRYGWWGIAYLEAILRLADHRVSEDESRRAAEQG